MRATSTDIELCVCVFLVGVAERELGAVLRLPCFRETLTEMMDEDGLLVLGHGLGQRQVLTSMVHTYCDPNFLVVLLNMTADEVRSRYTDVFETRTSIGETARDRPGARRSGPFAKDCQQRGRCEGAGRNVP